MSAYGRAAKLAQYQSVSVHGGVADADPHTLVLMLLDGIAERLSTVRGCIERKELVRKTKLLHSCVTLIAELRGSLNMQQGGSIAQNLSDLYEYMARRLIHANAFDDVRAVTEVQSLLGEIRDAWIAIRAEVRPGGRSETPGAWNAPGAPQLPQPKLAGR